jgi:ketosteroid isomerase-like protein
MRTLIDEYVAAYNAMDIPRMLSTLHPNVAFRNCAGGAVTAQADGIEAFERLARASLALFESREQVIRSYEEMDGVINLGVRFTAVVAKGAAGLAPGSRIEMDGRSVVLVLDGRILMLADLS